MDNRIFNVNGSGKELLAEVLAIAFKQSGAKTAEGWMFSDKHGFIIFAYGSSVKEGYSKFPVPLTAGDIAPMINTWINASPDAKSMKHETWDRDAAHDGHNTKGWRVYCEDWGHVNNHYGVICAVRPAFMWHGK